jgi:aldehyde dehydrogenase (NAD+)
VHNYPQADHATARRQAVEAVAAGGQWLDHGMADETWPRPWVVVDPPVEASFTWGEHFGPGLAVRRAEDDAEACRLHQRFPQRLVTAVFTRRRLEGDPAWTDLGGSVITVNDGVVPAAHPAAPLAGHGPSGWGVTQGADGLLALTRPLTVSRTSRWLRPPTDPPSESLQRRMRGFVRWWYR